MRDKIHPTSHPVLALSGVTKSYGRGRDKVDVLHGIDIEVRRGEVVWLRGASGSGKSSILRVAGLLTTVTSGVVAVNGTAVPDLDDAHALRRETIGMVFQHSNLLPELTALENVVIAMRDVDRAAAAALLERWGLGSVSGRRAKQLSGGESQRVALCRAIVNAPSLILADEPISGLDEANGDKVLFFLEAASHDGAAVLVASHDTSLERIATRTIDVTGGRLV
ncbi:ABC transporter ATP-binding protein [Sanguibacter sp. A247]|uniref:ABC transporter ATP-binding protein n=1 Tax=unclassified Sanguibacter TaxID=2645534 RepID=UPI003FD82858